jgi:hypothetical protein
MRQIQFRVSWIALMVLSATMLMAQTGGYRLQRSEFAGSGGHLQSTRYRATTATGIGNFGQMAGKTYVVGPLTVVEEEPGPSLPLVYELRQNYPNPFNQSTQLEWQVPQTGQVEIALFTVLGQQVTVLYQGEQAAGRYRLSFTGRDETGRMLTSGLYFCRMSAGSFSKHIKILLVR